MGEEADARAAPGGLSLGVVSRGSPPPGSPEELARFAALQAGLAPMFRDAYADPRAPRTVVVVPSLSLDPEELAKVAGVEHYEERQLSLLMWLRLPATRVVFVTSQPLDGGIIDYYLSLLAGVPGGHARGRLVLLSAYDGSARPLTDKILERPRLLARLRAAIGDPSRAHLTCFNTTHRERSLAVALGIPLYGCDPALDDLGSKSGSRETFREAGVPSARGAERLRDEDDVALAIAGLRREDPTLRRVVVKLEQGFSGEGNAVLELDGAPDGAALEPWLREALRTRLRPEAHRETIEHYLAQLRRMGGIAEAWLEGPDKASPSVQLRITPIGELEIVSTHDQVLGGPTGQVFLGSTFPARAGYQSLLHEAGWRVGEVLRGRGVLGRFSVDFVVTRDAPGGGWAARAIEINLRKGGTTLPFQMLQFLTAGRYEPARGEFVTPLGAPRAYYATDNLVSPAYRRLVPADLIDLVVEQDLHYHEVSQRGVVFNLIGAMSEYGKLGLVCIGETHEEARQLERRTVEVLDRETRAPG
jgi:hypothetical protein